MKNKKFIEQWVSLLEKNVDMWFISLYFEVMVHVSVRTIICLKQDVENGRKTLDAI